MATKAPAISTRVACSHCSLPVPRGLIRADADKQFCCSGCQAAYAIIHEYGLERYYALREADPSIPEPARQSDVAYEAFDEPAFTDRWTEPASVAGCQTARFGVGGMHCVACVWLLEKLPNVAPGVLSSRVTLGKRRIEVLYDPARTRPSAIARAIARLGYDPLTPRTSTKSDASDPEDRRALVRLGVAGACASNVMLIAIALYAGAFADMADEHVALFRWISLAISAVSVIWPGQVFFRSALSHLRARSIGLDVPIAIALTVGLVWSIVSTARGVGEVYYDSLSVLVFALLVARFIQGRQQRWAATAVEHLLALTPAVAHRVEANGSQRDVPIDALAVGDEVVVRPGEPAPADGRIVAGSSHVDAAILTGESRPVGVSAGDELFAGTVNQTAELRVSVTGVGESTRVGRLLRLMEEGASRKAPIAELADRAAGWFTLTVIALASIAALIAWPLGVGVAIERSVALLVVTCPCALGLATPLAVAMGLGRAARIGVLIKSGAALQALAGSGRVWLDKTGTITEGSPRIVHHEGDADAIRLAAALERDIPHPLASAIAEAADEHDQLEVENIELRVGAGVEGIVDGAFVRVGSPEMIFGESDDGWRASWTESCAAQALTPVFIEVDGKPAAALAIGDAIRPDSGAMIDALRRHGWRVGVLSGDDERVVEAVATDLDIDDAVGRASPERKLEIVDSLAAGQTTVMVGDGVNDAAALAAATVGIAVHGGAEASLDAADVYAQRPGLAPIIDTLALARRTMRVVKINLGISLGYNAIAATAAMIGYISPLAAAVLMPVSSLTVALNSVYGVRGASPKDAA